MNGWLMVFGVLGSSNVWILSMATSIVHRAIIGDGDGFEAKCQPFARLCRSSSTNLPKMPYTKGDPI